MENVILTIHLILALMLIGVVLLQRSEGGGLLSGGGAMTGRQAANALTKLTWIFAVCFIATSISLTVIAAKNAKGQSVVDLAPPASTAPDSAAPNSTAPDSTAPDGTAPAAPAPQGDLLPPSPSDAPATPPPAN